MKILGQKIKTLVLFGILSIPNAQAANKQLTTAHAAQAVCTTAKIICTNIAINQANKAPKISTHDAKIMTPIGKNAFLAADILGLVHNGIGLYAALELDPTAISAGYTGALASSTLTLLIDMYLHIKNGTPYTPFTPNDRITLSLTQAVEFSANLLAKYGSGHMLQTAEFKTSMHNVQAAMQAVETYLASKHCKQDNELVTTILSWTLGSIIAANGASALYYGTYLAPKVPVKPVPPAPVPPAQAARAARAFAPPSADATPAQQRAWLRRNHFNVACVNNDGNIECPVCQNDNAALHDDADNVIRIVHLGCNHLCCQECVRGQLAADQADPEPKAPIDIPADAGDEEIAALLRDEGAAIEGARIMRLRAQQGEYHCPVCREPSNVRDILNTEPEA